MGFNFPNTPTIGDLYPTPALPGVPQYRWDGAVWTTTTYDPLTWVQRAGDTMTGALNVVTPPTLPAHAASKAYVDAADLAAAPFASGLMYSGIQINGAMDVSQEFGTNAQNVVSMLRIIDGWQCQKTGTMAIVAGKGSPGPIGLPSMLFTSTQTGQPSLGANDFVIFVQYIEGYRTARLGWGTANAQPITISFWVMHTRPGLYSGAVRHPLVDMTWVFPYTVNAANTWEYKTATIQGLTSNTWATDNAIGLVLTFSVAVGSSGQTSNTGVWGTGNKFAVNGHTNGVTTNTDACRFAGVTVIPGIYAPTAAQSPLIVRTYDQELLICQRYWQRITAGLQNYPNVSPGGYYSIVLPYLIPMRITPTVTRVGDYFLNGFSAPSAERVQGDGFMVTAQSSASPSTSSGFQTAFACDARF